MFCENSQEKRPLREKFGSFFILHTLKTTPWIENLTQRWTTSGSFFPKPGSFFYCPKGQGKPPPWSSHMRCSIKMVFLKNFAKFIGQHLCQSLFFKKSTCIYNFFLKKAPAQVFSCELSKIIFFSEPLQTTVSEFFKWKETFWKWNFSNR